MTQTISLMGQLQNEHKKAKEQYAIYHHSNKADRATYYLGKMDGIESAMKVIAMQEGGN
jgi:hypothetical protein